MDLPAGEYTVHAKASDAVAQTQVRLPEGPTFLRGVDIAIVPTGTR